MKFSYWKLFNLTIEPKYDNSKIANKKSLEYLFCDEKKYKAIFKKTWWNFRDESKEKGKKPLKEEGIIVLWEDNYFETKENDNIFYDYSEIDFELTNWFQLEILNNYNDKSFLEQKYVNNNNEDNKINKYTLWYKSNSEKGKIYWFWGFVKFRIFNEENSFIFSPYFKTRNLKEDESVVKMLDDIKEELYYSLFTYKNISATWYKIKNKRDPNKNDWSFIKIFEYLYEDLEKSINNINENAKYKNSLEYEHKKYNWWKIVIDNRFINNSLQKWYFNKDTNKLNIFWKTIINRVVKSDYNNISNKIFLDLTQTLISKLEYFLLIWKDNININYLDTIKSKKNILKWKRKSFINRYEINLTTLSNYSIDYQHLDSKYKKFVLNYLRLFSILELFNWDLMLANKSIDQIYEYWTLIKLRDIIHNKLAKDSKKNIFKIKAKKWSILFELWNNEKITIKWDETTANIIYKFQQNIRTIPIWFKKLKNKWNSKIETLRTISAKSIPDIFIEIEKNKKYEYMVFDAKYSSNWNIKNRFENLYKYKSWILNCENLEWDWKKWNAWKMEQLENLQVIALYPWVKDDEVIEEETEIEDYNDENCEMEEKTEYPSDKLIKLYEKSVDDIWFWAYIMNPDDNNDNEMDNFKEVKKLVENKIVKIWWKQF